MTQAFEQSYAFAHKQENGSADAFILSTLAGETDMTYSGIYRAKQPGWPGWALIDAGETNSDRLHEMVKQFFFAEFWVKMNLEQLPFPLSGLVYDFGVNSGRGLAIQKLQQLIMVKDDGSLGPKTAAAARSVAAYPLMLRYIGSRLDFLNDLKGWKINSGGWSQRIAEILYFAAQ